MDLTEKIVQLQTVRARLEADKTMVDDHFLLDEGLELLANYRSIKDPLVRAAIKAVIKHLAAAQQP